MLLATFAALAFWGTRASGQPLLESDITAFRPNLSMAGDIVARRVNMGPGIVARRPDVEFELMAWLPKDAEKNVARLPLYKEELRADLIHYKEAIVARLPEIEEPITDWRIHFKEPIVARRVNVRESISWQPPDPNERYTAAR
jgi:hypothetical protein